MSREILIHTHSDLRMRIAAQLWSDAKTIILVEPHHERLLDLSFDIAFGGDCPTLASTP